MARISPQIVSETLVRCGRTGSPQYLTGPDMAAGLVSVPLFYVYPQGLDTRRMTDALAATLRQYPVLAGRMKKDDQGYSWIDPNDAGVTFREFRVDAPLPPYGPDHPMQPDVKQYFRKVYPWHLYKPETSLLVVNVFRFEDGGVVLSLIPVHAVVDASSMWGFLTQWSRVACEGGEAEPVVERNWLLEYSRKQVDVPYTRGAIRSLPLMTRLALYGRLLLNAMTNRLAIHRLTPEYLQGLQARYRREFPDGPPVSDADLLTALAIKVIAEERGFRNDLDVGAVMDLRFKKSLGIPRNLFGVALAQQGFHFDRELLRSGSMAQIAISMREQARSWSTEDWQGALGFLENHRSRRTTLSLLPESVIESLRGGFMQNNYCAMPVYGPDFGTGPAQWYTPEAVPFRMVKIVPGPKGDGALDLHLMLNRRELKRFARVLSDREAG